jgi:hypothetical protein
MEAKLKHLEFIQSAVARMATNSFLFKGWAITIAAGLSGFAAVNTKTVLVTIALVSSIMFWGLDGYYLWLERCFVRLHESVSKLNEAEIDFEMTPDKKHALRRWVRTCFTRPHLWFFYGSLITSEIIGIIFIKKHSGSN